MKNIVIFIALLTTINVVAQDTIKYGDPQYLFNRRVNPALSQEVIAYVELFNGTDREIIDFVSLNDTTGMPYIPMAKFMTHTPRSHQPYAIGFYTDWPIRIYGIAVNMFHIQGTTDIHDSVALFQYSRGTLKLLRVSNNCTRENLFMFEGDYILTYDYNQTPPQIYSYVERKTALSHSYEFFFDSPAYVHDTFFVWSKLSPLVISPLGVSYRNMPLFDSIGYPETPDDQFAERYFDFNFVTALNISNGEIYYQPQSGYRNDYMYWGMEFPIIMPLDGIDTLGEINPDSLWYYVDSTGNTDDSLGVREIGAEPEVGLSPNPASGTTTLTADVTVSRLLMHNVDGRLVRDLSPNATRVEIDLAGLPGGLYILSTVTPFGTAHRKLIVR